MAWFIHHSSRVRLISPTAPDVTELLVANMAEELRRLRARKINVTEDSVAFSSGVFRPVTPLNPLIPATRARISIVQEGESFFVAYRISFANIPIAVTAEVLLLGAFATWLRVPLTATALFLPLAWFWIAGLWRLLGAAFFDGFMRKLVREAGGVLSD